MITAFSELGEVTAAVPAGYEDRPVLAMPAGGIGELELALLTLLHVVWTSSGPASTVKVDSAANEAASLLHEAGWSELNRATWEGGLEDLLLRRGERCLLVSYDPLTHQIHLRDGKADLEGTLDLLRDDGIITGDEEGETVDLDTGLAHDWPPEMLTAAQDLLAGRTGSLPQPAAPMPATLVGLHPHADGTLRGPRSAPVVHAQLQSLLHAAGLHPGTD